MKEFIEAIKDWPVLLQGVLSSALFWIFLKFSSFLIEMIGNKYKNFSVSARKTWLINEQLKYEAITITTHEGRVQAVCILLYRASRPFTKASMWMVYGLILNSILAPAGVICFVASLYYFLHVYNIVGPIVSSGNPQERLKEITAELESLK